MRFGRGNIPPWIEGSNEMTNGRAIVPVRIRQKAFRHVFGQVRGKGFPNYGRRIFIKKKGKQKGGTKHLSL